MKVSIDSVTKALKKVNLTPADTRKVIEEIQLEADNNKNPHKAPAIKKQYVILVSDPDNSLKGKNLVGWALQIEDSASPAAINSRIKNASIEFNNSRKGRLLPVTTVGETLESVHRRFYDVNNPNETTLVKTKTPVLIITTDNKL